MEPSEASQRIVEVETAQGTVVVSNDLLTTSANTTEAPSSPTNGPVKAVTGMKSPQLRKLSSSIPLTTANRENPTRVNERPSVESASSSSYSSGQLQSPESQPASTPQILAVDPGQLALPQSIAGGSTTIPEPLEQRQVQSEPSRSNLGADSTSTSATSGNVPSYMSPESIRARNILLAYNHTPPKR